MTDKLGGIANYLIGVGFMTYILFIVKRKGAEQPQIKIGGLSVKTIINITYAGIIIDIFLIVAILMGWIKN